MIYIRAPQLIDVHASGSERSRWKNEVSLSESAYRYDIRMAPKPHRDCVCQPYRHASSSGTEIVLPTPPPLRKAGEGLALTLLHMVGPLCMNLRMCFKQYLLIYILLRDPLHHIVLGVIKIDWLCFHHIHMRVRSYRSHNLPQHIKSLVFISAPF